MTAVGTLYIVATPIGHLQDITLRALDILKLADLIACEDTRRTAQLLTHFGIRKPLISYFQHNRRKREGELMAALKSGKNLALVTDAGTPAINDPGADLVTAARTAGIAVIPIPGPSSPATLLSVAGFEGPVLLMGYLPPKSATRRRLLGALKIPEDGALLIFEGPHRLEKTLNDILEVWGDRGLIYGREMTKIHEEYRQATVSSLLEELQGRAARGEYTLLVLPMQTD